MATGQSELAESQLRGRLRELVRVLEQIESTVSVTVAALRHQDAERDQDIAKVLQCGAGDLLSAEIEKTIALLGE